MNWIDLKNSALEEYRALLTRHGVTGKRQNNMACAFEDGVLTGLKLAAKLDRTQIELADKQVVGELGSTPENMVPCNLRAPKGLLASVDAYAEEHHMDRSAAIRALLDAALSEEAALK